MSRPARATHGDYGFARRRKCPCDPCKLAVRRYAKKVALERHRGIDRRLKAGPVRAHIEELMEAGAARHQISNAAGLSDSVIKNILQGMGSKPRAEFVLRPTASKILGVTIEDALAIPTYVSNVGIHRRIRALECMGHPKSRIAEVIGVTESQVFLYLKRERAYSTVVDKVHAAYVELRREEGTSAYTLWRARRRGDLPPMCWDDATIDDPEAVPARSRCIVTSCGRMAHRASVCRQHHAELSARGGLSDPRRYRDVIGSLGRRGNDSGVARDNVRDCRAHGFTPEATARHLGLTKEYVDQLWRVA